MVISISFSGFQRLVTGTDKIHLTLKEGTRVLEVVALVKSLYRDLPFGEESVLVTVNLKVVPGDSVVKSGDDIAFLPFIGGG